MGWIIGFLKKLFPRFFAQLSRFLIGFISPIIGPLLEYIAKFFSKLGMIVLVIGAIGAAITAFTVALNAIGSGIAAQAPNDLIVIGRMFIPSNFSIAISTLLLARLKSLIFMWVIRITEKFENA
ncbi:hypothetical protein DK254_27545 [Pseudomonas sp. RW407]|uniref:DUF5455 family protein n=1 Tax=Pseudomonas sp. RW407 TaxID=2202894 RepID=UPI000D700B41|nr:DUF5455 family protein [Pseudomonas sp. RW407]PWU26336.1 hypothetical protein DK254_27545 [Pseudomonas sp. RW407]